METITTDGLTLTRDESTELCIHHLRLAAMFFEAGGSYGEHLEELHRQFKTSKSERPWLAPAEHWLREITDEYDRMNVFG